MESGSLASWTIGPQSWREKSEHSIRRAEKLIRQSDARRSSSANPCGTRSCTAGQLPHANTRVPLDLNEAEKNLRKDIDKFNNTQSSHKVRPMTTGTMVSGYKVGTYNRWLGSCSTVSSRSLSIVVTKAEIMISK